MKSACFVEDGSVSGRSPHGERGLKLYFQFTSVTAFGRSPHGERGLKLVGGEQLPNVVGSLSSWRAWIEIGVLRNMFVVVAVALLMESVD